MVPLETLREQDTPLNRPRSVDRYRFDKNRRHGRSNSCGLEHRNIVEESLPSDESESGRVRIRGSNMRSRFWHRESLLASDNAKLRPMLCNVEFDVDGTACRSSARPGW